jgi:hypothetical protein
MSLEDLRKLTWQVPDSSPLEIAKLYVQEVRRAPTGVEVWCQVDGAVLHFYTVLDKEQRSESAVYAAEMAVLQEYGTNVDFDVYPDREPLEAFIGELTPLLQLV